MKKLLSFVFILLIQVLLVVSVFADACDSKYDMAQSSHRSANRAMNARNYKSASYLYEQALTYYVQAAEMKKCRCPKIAGLSRRGAAKVRSQLKRAMNAQNRNKSMAEKSRDVQNTGQSNSVVGVYNQAQSIYSQGNAYAMRANYKDALAAFEKAHKMWQNIASNQSKVGRMAVRSARAAHRAALSMKNKIKIKEKKINWDNY